MATNSIIKVYSNRIEPQIEQNHVRIEDAIQKTSESFQTFITLIANAKVSTKTQILNALAIKLEDRV